MINEQDFYEIKKENDVLKRILSMLPEHVYWKNIDGEIMGCNLPLANAFGYESVEEYIGKTDYDVVDKTEADISRNNDLQVMQTAKPFKTEETVYINGEEKTYLSTKTPMLDNNNEVSGIIGISIDITDQKRNQALEKDLAITQERLKVAHLMSASISHEVRTPLARLALELEDLKEYAESTDKTLKPTAKNIESSLISAHHIIEMLLLKAKTDKLSITDQCKLSLKAAISEALEEYPFKKGQKELVHTELDQDFSFTGKMFHFKHIIFNLLKNSFYAIQKARKGNISISINSKNRTLIFEDSACGIPANVLPHIFESFYTQSERGTGVGLALCKQIMKEFGGTFDCTTKEGEFTRFTVTFPHTKD